MANKVDESIFAHINILGCFHAVDHRTEVVLWQIYVAELIQRLAALRAFSLTFLKNVGEILGSNELSSAKEIFEVVLEGQFVNFVGISFVELGVDFCEKALGCTVHINLII